MWLAILLCVTIASASLFCPYTKEPNVPESYSAYRIQSFPAPVGSSSPALFKLLPTDGNQSSVRFLTVSKFKTCPDPCLVELHGFVSTREDTIMYQLSQMAPGNYEKINNTKLGRMFCAPVKDDCGATVPIYRHFQFGPHGIHHAYGFSATEKIGNFSLEPPPLCYGWAAKSASRKPVSASKQCSSSLPPLDSVRPLNIYDNSEPGHMRDHFYSAALPNDFLNTPELSPFVEYRYKMLDDLGMVVVEPKASECNCLVKLVQMYDKHDGLFGRRDHKLIIAGEESNRPMEAYEPTGEVVYCATEKGACGATVPLRKYLDIGNLDTIYTVNTTVPPPMSTPYPDKVLCWIWAVDLVAPMNRPPPERRPRVTASPGKGCSCTCEIEAPIPVGDKPYFEENHKSSTTLSSHFTREIDGFPTPRPFSATTATRPN
ncbi:hypothetical protein L596_009681 [Steinernema carpocapsae]|uniref:Uncharacterized protein n=2 Tax=Steinernema carpocapsae TaxID=34508 RepID=A0A4U5PGV5_STECR|nr:hypothetical protein L596_009681 [Steinernema carpocapsae]